jgi:hypothetical protein
LKKNKDIALALIKANSQFYNILPPELRSDKNFNTQILAISTLKLSFFYKKIRGVG